MQQQDVAELLRATASDAGAVAQYLVSIDSDELNGLLDRFAAHEAKKKNDQQRGDWLALVQLLLRSQSARLRTATRIIQLVWNGSSSELECMQWLTEISLGYLGALEDENNSNSSSYDDNNNSSSSSSALNMRLRLTVIADEVRMLLRILFELLSDGLEAHGTANARKALPQMLSLLPILFGVLVELASSSASNNTEKSEQELHENLVRLMELPWNTKTIPLLLDLLRESASIVSASGWSQLEENIERMVTGVEELPSESMNPIIRECISIASVTGNCHWINIARHLFRKLPPRLRQEAEFSLQMCLHQCQNAVSLVCESIRTSLLQSDNSAGDGESEPPEGELRLSLDWRDLVFLFHALQVSKPILHHRTTSSRIATEATIFTEIEKLTWAIFRLNLTCYQCEASSDSFHTLDLAKYLTERVTQILTFGGKQVHSREWKALLLMDFAFYWMESEEMSYPKKPVGGLFNKEEEDRYLTEEASRDSSAAPSKGALARLLLLALFQTAPEIRSEMLSNLFEGSKNPERLQVTGKALDQLFRTQSTALFPHLNAIQDWLKSVTLPSVCVLFQSHFSSARAFFLMASQLTTAHKDLYNFLMVFLRKLLSVSNPAHQQFAIDLWCSWLELGLRFDALQEEEIVSALKNSLLVCQGTHAWGLGRLEQVFRLETGDRAKIRLRWSSWEELHRVLSSELSQFIQPASPSHLNGDEYGDNGDENKEADEDEYSSSQRHRFQLGALDRFYRQNSSADGAAAVGLVFQKALSCLLSFESAAVAQSAAEDTLSLSLSLSLPVVGANMMHWIMDFVSNWEFFFHWISQSSDDDDDDDTSDFGANNNLRGSGAKALDKKVMWRLLSRIGIASALCSVAIEQLLRRSHDSVESGESDYKGASMWSLLEVQLCLHRLLRKLMSTYGTSIDVKQSKDYLAASFYGVSSVIDTRSAQIIGDISCRLTGSSTCETTDPSSSIGTESPRRDASGLSFDSVLFVLDSCCNNSAESESRSHASRAEAGGGVLKALLSLYFNVRDHAFPNADSSDSTESMSDPRSVFTVYADSLVLKFPKSLRHLVAMPKNAKQVMLLDAKAAEDILVRVFAAIGRVLDQMVDESGAEATDRRVRDSVVMTNAVIKSERGGEGLVTLAAIFLQDLRALMAVRELSKLKVTTALLVKRLCELGAEVAATSTSISSSSNSEAFASQMLQLSSVSYTIMCEHVVYHAPLLRALLSVCFSVHLGKTVESVVNIAGSIEGFLLASGFEIALLRTLRALSRRKRKADKQKDSLAVASSPEPYTHQEPVTPSKRRRLRQTAAIVRDSDLHDIGERDESDEEEESVHPQPHLASSGAQSAAILALLALLESVQSTLFKQLSIRKSADQQTRIPSSPQSTSSSDAVLCAHIYEFVLRALLATKDASWVNNAKVLLKLLSVVEWSLRIGRASCFFGGSGSSGSAKKSARVGEYCPSESCIDILDGAVQIGLQARVWVNLLKESIKESAVKTRVSAISLKIDVFLLDVPQIVQLFSRELTDPQRERIRAMLSLVTDQMAPMAGGATPATKKKANTHMVGVVPIVKKRKKRLRSRHPYIDDWLRDEDGSDAYADLEDFIE